MRGLAILAAASLLAGTAQAQSRCPAELIVSEQPVAPPGMRGEGAQRSRPLLRMSVFDGMPSENVNLAPVRESREGALTIQVFELPQPRERPAILVCRYADTPATLTAALPTSVRRCTFRFAWNAAAKRIDIGKVKPEASCG